MMKHLLLLFSISVLALSLNSCRQDAGFEKTVEIDSTDYRYDLIGNWSFKSTTQDDQWIYEWDSTGNGGFQHYQSTNTNWEYQSGTVEASSVYNEIKVKFSENHTAKAMIVYSNGSLGCSGSCDDYGFYNDPQYGGGPQGCWHIDSTYCQALSGPNLPGHVTSTTISGFKLD